MTVPRIVVGVLGLLTGVLTARDVYLRSFDASLMRLPPYLIDQGIVTVFALWFALFGPQVRFVVGVFGLIAGVGGALLLYQQWLNQSLVFAAIPAVLLTISVLSGWFALRVPQVLNDIGRAVIVGFIGGIAGLAAGIYWAIHFYPESNILPVLALGTSAPAGFVLGCVGGAIWFGLRRKGSKSELTR